MKFRTELELSVSDFQITHRHKILGVGSCFVDSIGEKLSNAKFEVMTNPFGTLFHPLAIENALARIIGLNYYTEEEIFKSTSYYFSWDHHTSFNQTTLKATLEKINNALEMANRFVSEAGVFLITLGTSFAYKIKDHNLFVANCHKAPASYFEKVLLSDLQIKTSIRNIFNLIHDVNPKAEIIVTVSPVRHIKDGIVENNVSKAKLISNLHEILSQSQNAEYFPAYELMMDDLRDYRFYKEDLIHPSEVAIGYIWEKFGDKYFHDSTKKQIRMAEKINAAMAHRPLNPESMTYKEFLFKTLKNIEGIENQFPKNSFYSEKLTLKNRMRNAD